ncbi:cyclodeaminase/cyclohydrolase family protein [uncultured Cetobacterium sp.]|uniref:cyclodeaminase/cyclohydrolase family protein n=1 Tax=uncultured Cetobacterium sp. TaxID=527638 RepID=UPI0026370ED3|nr:cyclodeaminase/cyclohydrolase family protein [uncultured Cetobacterium sp.]
MDLFNLSVKDFLQEVDSSSPAPGGGSVSALVSTLGSSLGRMVAHLTFSKKAYKELPEEDQQNFSKSFNEIGFLKSKLEILIDEDTKVYNLVMKSYKLPKETEEEKEIRKEEIQKALKKAIETPLNICKLSLNVLENLDYILKFGNKNAITDLGVSAILLFSGIEGGILNVKVNLSSLDDTEYKNKTLKEIENILKDSKKIKENILEVVNSKL